MEYYQKETQQILKELNTTTKGLTNKQIKEKIEQIEQKIKKGESLTTEDLITLNEYENKDKEE